MVTFLEDCPAGKLEAIDAAIADRDAKRRGAEEAQLAAQEELKGLDEADRTADQESIEIMATAAPTALAVRTGRNAPAPAEVGRSSRSAAANTPRRLSSPTIGCCASEQDEPRRVLRGDGAA